MKHIWSSVTHLSIRPFKKHELANMTLIKFPDLIKLINMIGPHLRSLCIISHCFNTTAFQFGSRDFRVDNINVLELFETIGGKCVNLEEVHINSQFICDDCIEHVKQCKLKSFEWFDRGINERELLKMIVKNNNSKYYCGRFLR